MQTAYVTTPTAHPIQLVAAGDGPTLIFNNDDVNQIYLSNEIGLNVNSPETLSILEPLGSLCVMGTQDIYAAPVTPGVTVQVFIIPDGIQFTASPQQIAAQINALGLATSALQTAQQNTLVSGIGLPLNASKETGGNLASVADYSSSIATAAGSSIAQTDDVTLTLPTNLGAVNGTSAGVGINHGVKNLYTAGFGDPLSIVAGGTETLIIGFDRPGYIIRSQPFISGAEASPLLEYDMQWYDTTIGAPIAEEIWYCPLPNSSSGTMKLYGKGPTKANQLQLKITNLSAVETASVVISIDETSHHISRDDWRTNEPSSVATSTAPGFSIPSGDPFALLQANMVVAGMAASATEWWLLPLYAGEVFITVNQSVAQASLLQVVAWSQVISLVPFNGPSLLAVSIPAAKQNGPYSVYLPRMPCLVSFTNGAAAANIAITVNGIEYAS